MIAVTGAAGFIGSHTVATLARTHPLKVHAGPLSETRNVAGVAVVLKGDITDSALLDELVQGVRVVVHAAGPPSVAESFDHPAEYMRVHAVGTACALEACVRAGVKRIVYVSSAETYGNRTPACVAETQPQSASSPYGAAKIGAEQLVRAFALAGKIEAFVLRPFSVYGPGMSPNGVVAQFLEQALRHEVIRVRDPRPVRDFCFVSDVADAVAAACTAPLDRFAIANLGSGSGTSIGELATLASELAGAPGIAEAGEKRPFGAEISCLIADVAQAKELLGWTAQTSLRAGLTQTIEWMKAR